MNKVSENKKKKSKASKRAVSEFKATVATSTTYIISALTLVAGLAWNEFAKAVFERLAVYVTGWGEIVGLFLYAIVVTIIVVLIVRRLQKLKEAIGGKSIK